MSARRSAEAVDRSGISRSAVTRRIGLLLLAGSVSACFFSEKDHDPTYRLTSGTYEGSWETIVENMCFPDGVPVPSYVPILTEVGVLGTALTLQPVLYTLPTTVVLPSMQGVAGDTFSATGGTVLTFSTACSLAVSTAVSGEMVKKHKAEFIFTIGFDASTTATNDCSVFAGESVNNLPFPELSSPENGSCSLTVEGSADLY